MSIIKESIQINSEQEFVNRSWRCTRSNEKARVVPTRLIHVLLSKTYSTFHWYNTKNSSKFRLPFWRTRIKQFSVLIIKDLNFITP